MYRNIGAAAAGGGGVCWFTYEYESIKSPGSISMT